MKKINTVQQRCQNSLKAGCFLFLASGSYALAEWTQEIDIDPITGQLNHAMARSFGVEQHDDGFISYLCTDDRVTEISIMWKHSLKVRKDASGSKHQVTVRFGEEVQVNEEWFGVDQFSFSTASWRLRFRSWAFQAEEKALLAIRTTSETNEDMTLVVDASGLQNAIRAVDAVCK